jgi:hypothetical protein
MHGVQKRIELYKFFVLYYLLYDEIRYRSLLLAWASLLHEKKFYFDSEGIGLFGEVSVAQSVCNKNEKSHEF